jgi:hypothetical protein
MDPKRHLRDQLQFLERSCASWDAGYRNEGVRIANAIYILLHHRGRNKSLLHHLGMPRLPLVSTVRDLARQMSLDSIPHFMGMGSVRHGYRDDYVPSLGDGPTKPYAMEAPNWWNQVVMILNGHRFSRESIVGTARDKDGGSHVDSKLTPEYEALAREGATGSFVYLFGGGRMEEMPMPGAHLVCLRQMGYEAAAFSQAHRARRGLTKPAAADHRERHRLKACSNPRQLVAFHQSDRVM